MTTLTRDEFEIRRPADPDEPADTLLLPCGPDHGCDYADCEGWTTQRDQPSWSENRRAFEFRRWSAEEIAEARRYRDSMVAQATPSR